MWLDQVIRVEKVTAPTQHHGLRMSEINQSHSVRRLTAQYDVYSAIGRMAIKFDADVVIRPCEY